MKLYYLLALVRFLHHFSLNVHSFFKKFGFIQFIVFKELLSAAQQGLISLIKTNIGTLLEVTDSIWIIVKQNLNVLLTIVGSLFSLLLGGGNAVITFLINSVCIISIFQFRDFKIVPLLIDFGFAIFRLSF